MRNGYFLHTLTSVDIPAINKIVGKVIEIYEVVIYRENFKVSPFRNNIDKIFEIGQKYDDEINDVMQLLVTFSVNSLYGEKIRKVFPEKLAFKSEYWMHSEYDERIIEYWKVSNGNKNVKKIHDRRLEGEVKRLNNKPLQLSAYVLSNSRRIMNNFIPVIDGL